MALPQGINFRASSGYVSDGPNDYAQTTNSLNYPTTTPQDNDVGWESGQVDYVNDRDSGVDARLAGTHGIELAQSATYRIDLPAPGSYNIRAAFGSATSGFIVEAYLYDNNTLVATLASNQAIAFGQFVDASDTLRSSPADWVANNAAITQSFSSTIMRVVIPTGGNYRTISHLYVESAGGGAAALAGDAAGQASATGNLTTDIPLTGASVVVATATGSLNVPIDLSGNAAAVSAAAASLTTQIPVAGVASGNSAASGELSSDISLSSDANTQSTATADLTATITLSGAAVAQALANAGIDTSILLGANAAGQATATGALDGDSNIAGNAQTSASATGSLDTAIDMAGAAQGSANATGWIEIYGGTLADLYTSMGSNDGGVSLQGNPVKDWTQQAVVGMGNQARGDMTPNWWTPADTSFKSIVPWTAATCWFVAWPGVNHASTNTGVNIQRLEFWVQRHSTGEWRLENYDKLEINWPPTTDAVESRVEADGSRSFFLSGAKNSGYVATVPYAVHGSCQRFSLIDGDDIRCIFARLKTKLVLEDPNGPNDMAASELYVDIGADYWSALGVVVADYAPEESAPQAVNSRFERVTVAPRYVQMASINPPSPALDYPAGDRSIDHATFESDLPPPLMPFAADAAAQATASGDLTTGIPLDADAASQATASGDISGAAQLAGAANADATATGSLTIQIQLSANAIAQALATANLDAPVNLAGQAASSATAAGNLTTQINMDADAQADITAIGQLSAAAVPLAGDAAAIATGQGDLNTAITIDGAALNVVSGTGSLTVNLGISGHAAALVAAGADLTTQIPLNAAAVAEVLSTANLSGGVSTLKPNPKYTVIAPWRNYRVAA